MSALQQFQYSLDEHFSKVHPINEEVLIIKEIIRGQTAELQLVGDQIKKSMSDSGKRDLELAILQKELRNQTQGSTRDSAAAAVDMSSVHEAISQLRSDFDLSAVLSAIQE